MEPINLMRCETGDFFRGDPDSEKWRGEAVTWFKALPRAEYDALVKEREAMKGAIKTTMEAIGTISAERDAAIERAEKAERELVAGEQMELFRDEQRKLAEKNLGIPPSVLSSLPPPSTADQ